MSYRDDKIRAAQAAQKLTIEQLVEKTKLNKNTISDIRQGKESIELKSLQKVADALGVPMAALFDNSRRNRVA